MPIGVRFVRLMCAVVVASAPAGAAAAKMTPAKASATARAKAAQHREKGLAAMAAGRDDQAMAEFGLAVEADPTATISPTLDAFHEVFGPGEVEE